MLISLLFTLSTTIFSSSYQGLGANSLDPKVLEKYAPKEVPNLLAGKIQKMLDVRSPGMGLPSPDGKNLYFSWNVTGTNQIWKLDNPLGFPTQLTGGEDPAALLDITNDGKTLIISRDINGEENPGLYYMNTAGGELQLIQKKKDVQVIFNTLSDDSQFVYFTANDITPNTRTLYRFDFKTKKIEQIFHQDGNWGIVELRKNKILLYKAKTNVASEYHELDLATKTLKPILGTDEFTDYRVTYGKNDDQFFVLTNKFRDFNSLYLYNAKDNSWKGIIENNNFEIDDFFLDYNKSRINYSINDKGFTSFKVINTTNYKEISLPKFQGIHQFTGTLTRNDRYMTIGIVTAKKPRASYVYDWKTKKLTQWIMPSTPEVDTSEFAESTLEYYPAEDGTPIPMFVTRPKNCIKKTCPVIVDFHGGPEGQSTPGFSPTSQLFINEGFILVEPNVRGSSGYGKKWLDSDNGPQRLKVISDIKTCADFIRKNWSFNGVTPKIGIMGGSYGGYSTLFGMSYYAGSYDAGVASVGMSNLVTFLKNTAPYRRPLRISEYGDPEKDLEALIQLSPITHVDKIKAPLLIIQGANDPRVPAGEAVQIQTLLEKKKIPSDLILFADEGHGASKRSNRVYSIGHTLDFFIKHLK